MERAPALTGVTFADLIESFTTDKARAPMAIGWTFEDYDVMSGRTRMETIPIGPYCMVHAASGGYLPALYIRPTVKVIDLIKSTMIAAGVNDSIYFEIYVRHDGTSSLYAKNNAIIGSQWIADFPGIPFTESVATTG